MARRLPVVLCAAAAVWLGAVSPARADDWSLHVVGAARLGWTDNLFSSSGDAGAPPKDADEYTQLGPGALFTLESSRAVYTVGYDLDANLYVKHTEAWTVTHHVALNTSVHVTPLADLQASLLASAGTLNTFSTTGTAADGTVQFTPSAASDYEAVDATQSYNVQVTHDWHVTQSANAHVFSTQPSDSDISNTGESAGLGLGVDRTWRYTGAGAHTEASVANLGVGGDQLTTALTGSARRDIGAHWSAGVELGGTAIFGGTGGSLIEPTGAALVGYFPTWGSAGLSLRRSLQANLQLGADTTTTGVVANAGLPVHWLGDDDNGMPRLGFQGTAGYSIANVREASSGADESGGFHLGSIDVAVSYALEAQLHFSMRYQYEHQVASAAVQASMTVPVYSFDRNTVLFSFDGRWPERLAGEIPIKQPLRVDDDQRSDDATDVKTRDR